LHENPSRSCSSTRLYPPAPECSDDYTIIQISVFEGRSGEAEKLLVALLLERLHEGQGLLR
jgi:Tautomerase enzyme